MTQTGDSVQTFEILERHKEETFRYVRVEIHDNHGHDVVTCVYSFRVDTACSTSSLVSCPVGHCLFHLLITCLRAQVDTACSTSSLSPAQWTLQ
uniref:SUN domain-containing protein n=1 Tax=Knipowitschia caucasica TaxID=637954 RepID=A0AAV2KQ03_KNICA